MAKAKVKKDFIALNPPEKFTFGTDRHADMTGSADLNAPAAPFHTLAHGATANTDLQTAITNAAGGGVGTAEALVVAIAYWDEVYLSLADFTDSVAKGDLLIITEGGWDYTDIVPTKRPLPDQVIGLKVKQMEQAGSIKVGQRYKTANKDKYVTILSPDANVDALITVINGQLMIAPTTQAIIIVTHSKGHIVITNLVSGTRYHGYRFAFNTTGRGPDSQKFNLIAP